MLLLEVPKGSKIKIVSETKLPPGSAEIDVKKTFIFDHVDGMYSYCIDDKNQIVHLSAFTEVEIVND